jgi:hypothetical protein
LQRREQNGKNLICPGCVATDSTTLPQIGHPDFMAGYWPAFLDKRFKRVAHKGFWN